MQELTKRIHIAFSKNLIHIKGSDYHFRICLRQMEMKANMVRHDQYLCCIYIC